MRLLMPTSATGPNTDNCPELAANVLNKVSTALSRAGFAMTTSADVPHQAIARISANLSFDAEDKECTFNGGAVAIDPGAVAEFSPEYYSKWRFISEGNINDAVRVLQSSPQVLALVDAPSQSAAGAQTDAAPPKTLSKPEEKAEPAGNSSAAASGECASGAPLAVAPADLQFVSHGENDGPSYSETLGWLAKTLAGLDTHWAVDGVDTRYLSGIFGFDDCSVRLRSGLQVKTTTQCELVPVKFGAIDPVSVKVAKNGDLWTVADSAEHVIWFNDRELAKRVAKAWSHAAQLCGGRVEPF